MLVEEDSLSSALNFRLSELVEDSERSDARHPGPGVTLPHHFVAFLPLSVFATLMVVAGPVVVVAALVPRHGMLLEVLAVLLTVGGSLAIASVGNWLWMRWPHSREVIFAELMLWGWVRRFWAERRLARTRDLFESARESGSTVSIELLTQLSDLHQAVDPYLHGHSRRVASYAGRIAREMRLSPKEIADVETAALVHDVGKIYTPREILHKAGRLTDREFAIVKLHARDGAEILADAGDPQLTAIVRHHHERLDGNGYPDGIKAAQIPLGSRIIAVADTFDAITSTRPYRPQRTHKEALDILSNESGTQLDATVVAAFLACYAARRPVARSAFASAVAERFITAIKASSTSLTTGSIAQTLPALGAAGVLAVSPAPHHGKVDRRHEATQMLARQASGPAPVVRAGDAKTVPRSRQLRAGRPLVGKLGSPRRRINLPDTNSISPSVDTSPGASTSEPGSPSESHGAVQNPVGSGSEPSKPTAPVSAPPQTSQPVNVQSPPVNSQPPQSPQPTPPVHPTESPVEVPSIPPVTISVPNTPVQVSLPGITVPTVNLPVNLPTNQVSSVLQSVGLRVGG
jgi:putative nucleotidyltransferase with HDIG domain